MGETYSLGARMRAAAMYAADHGLSGLKAWEQIDAFANEHDRIVAGLEADARRLKFLADNKLCVTPIEGGGWDVYRYDDGCVEYFVATASTLTGAIDAAIDAFLAQTEEG